MKNKNLQKSAFKKAFIIFYCTLVFFLASYAYLQINIGNGTDTQADAPDYTIPYKRTPDDKGIAFIFPDNSFIIVYLNFNDSSINILNVSCFDEKTTQYSGYTTDFKVYTDYELIEGIVDRVGGINLEIDGQTMRYTGNQITEFFSIPYTKEFKNEVISQIFNQISKNGLSKDDFSYIIENSDTDLTIPDCFDWFEYIKDMSSRVSFVN